MKINEIQSLIRFVAKSGVSEMELELTDFSIKIKNSGPQPEAIVQIPTYVSVSDNIPTLKNPLVSAQSELISLDKKSDPLIDESKYITVKSPMIGTFYKTAGPGKPPFVTIGDEIKNGQTLCIVEAMKLFNEIESEVSGKIIKILVNDLSPVEYDTPLFLVALS